MKKFICLLLLALSFNAYTEKIKVFDFDFSDGKNIVFYLNEAQNENYAFFLDEKKAEANVIFCDETEYNELKKIAFECKVLINSVSNRTTYEEQNIYQKIIGKLKAFAPNITEEYESLDNYGLTKINLLSTKKNLANNPDINHKTFSERFQSSKKLNVWSYTDEIKTMIDKYYKSDYQKDDFDYTTIPADQLSNKLDSAFALGNETPDVFTMEDTIIRKYIEQGDKLLLDLTDIYNEVKDKTIPYPFDVATFKGKVYAMSWHAVPGAFFYRRSLAKKYLGTDDPAIVQKSFANWDSFLKTARELKKASGGKCVVISSTEDLFHPFLGSRNGPWIQNNKLVIDPAMEDYMKMAKTLKDERLEGGQGQWGEGWFAAFNGELRDDNWLPLEVFGTFLPPWGLHFVLKPNAKNTAGDWAMIQGPSPYFWGGTWVAAYKNTKNPKLAKKFIKYITTDNGFLTRWAKDTGELVSNNSVISVIKDLYSEPFLNGQNPYEEFSKIAQHVNGKLNQSTDPVVEDFWKENVKSYIYGKKSKVEALYDFKKSVHDELGY